jgi:hypothetical protein
MKVLITARPHLSVKAQTSISPKRLQQPTTTRIIRAVASSTALETGQSIKELEARLLAQDSKFQQLPLATAL